MLDKILQFIGSLFVGMPTETLLWTNPSPGISFAAQTIALDLSGYDGMIITYAITTSGQSTGNQNVNFESETGIGSMLSIASSRGDGPVIYHRDVRLATDKQSVIFGVGYVATVAGQSVNNSAIIPSCIYGIKRFR